MSEWQPIETAPKSGDFLVSCLHGSERYFAIAYMRKFPMSDDEEICQSGTIYWLRATHWMPLPEPPK